MDTYGNFESRKPKFTVYINEGERYQIEQWVLEHQNIETGGDLFGLWMDDRTAIVQFVLGPGTACRRTSVSFYQDIEYLRKAGSHLTQQHGLCNIGQWHSHHRLGLTRPSGGDEHTVWGNMPNLGLDRYIVFIATINESYPHYYYERRSQVNVNINPYLFEIKCGHRSGVLDGEIKYMKGNSPFRLDKSIQNTITYGAEKINEVKKFPKKRQHETEKRPTDIESKQPKSEVKHDFPKHAENFTESLQKPATTNDVNTETENGDQFDSHDVKANQNEQPNSLQKENLGRNAQHNSITPALDNDDNKKFGVESDSSRNDIMTEDEQNNSQSKSTKESSGVLDEENDESQTENGDQVAGESFEGDQMRQPNSPGDDSNVQNESTTLGSNEDNEQDSAGDKHHLQTGLGERYASGDKRRQAKNLQSDADNGNLQGNLIAQGSDGNNDQNSSPNKSKDESFEKLSKEQDQDKNTNGEQLDSKVSENQSIQPNSPQRDGAHEDDDQEKQTKYMDIDGDQLSASDVHDEDEHNKSKKESSNELVGDQFASENFGDDEGGQQGSSEDDEQNSAGDEVQVENENSGQVDSEILKEDQRAQPNGSGDDGKEQVGSHEGKQKDSAQEKNQVKNHDGDQSGRDCFEDQKKEKNPNKIDDQFSTNRIQRDNEPKNSHHTSARKNLDDHEGDTRHDQNGQSNVPQGVAESDLKQGLDETNQYKIPTTPAIDQRGSERSEEKEQENKDQAAVTDEHLSSPKSSNEEMQTDVGIRYENESPKTNQAVKDEDQNEAQVENMDVDNDIFSSNNEPAKVDQETLEMETESIKEPTSVDELNCEIPQQMSIAPEETTDPNKNQQTQDPVMSIEEDSQTQGDGDIESKKMVNDEERKNKSPDNTPPLQDLNDHNADDKVIDSEENNNPAAKPIEDEHSLILRTLNGNAKEGLTSESAVNEPEEQDSCIIPPSKMDTYVPTSNNINDKPSKMSNDLALDSKQIEDVTCLHNEQSVENQEKNDSVNLRNSNSNANIQSDSISTNPKQKKANLCNQKKEVTLQELPSSNTTMLKKDTTSNNDDISINEPATNAAVEESNSEQIKETGTTSSDQMAEQNEYNEYNLHVNIVEHPAIGRKIESNEYPQSPAKDQFVGGNVENSRSQSMHGDLSNKNSKNRRSRSIFDRPEFPDNVEMNVPEGILSIFSNKETKLERKNSQDDHLNQLKSEHQDLLELESQQSADECDIELASFGGTDPKTDKGTKKENQNKDSLGVSEKIEAKNETVDCPIAQEQQQDIEQIESIPESKSKHRSKKKKMKIPKKLKKLKRMLGKKKKRDKSEKKKGIRRLFKKKSNKISESKIEKTSTEASTMSAGGDDDSTINTVTNKTKDESIDAIEVLESNEDDTNKDGKKAAKKRKRKFTIWRKNKNKSKEASELVKGKEGDIVENVQVS